MALRLKLPFRVPGPRSEPGVWVSAGAHAAILVAALVAFAGQSLPEAQEGIPVEVMTDNEFSQITKGERTGEAPKPDPKPRADRVAERREERDPGEAKQDVPTPPQRPPEMKTAEAETPPPPPLRPALEQPQPVSVPAPPERPDPKVQEAARAEAAAKEAARAAAKAAEARAAEAKAAEARAEKAEAAREAKAEAAKAEAARREEMAKLVERQEAEAEAKAAKAEAKAAEAKLAEAKAKAELQKKIAEAQARAEAAAKAQAAEAKLAEAKAADAKAAEAKAAEAKAAEVKAAETKRVAEAKAKADARARADAEARARAKAELAKKFDTGDIRALLASKEPSRSSGATGREVQRVASLGTEVGSAEKLSPSQRDALVGMLQSQIERCYAAPPGAAGGIVLPVLDIRLNQDGSFASEPRLMRGGASTIDTAIAQAALRAVRRCAPYKIPAQFMPFYNDWKIINATFDLPRA